MNEIQHVSLLIKRALNEIQEMRQEINQQRTEVIDLNFMIKDLGVSKRHFYEKIKPSMDFLFALNMNGKLHAIRHDYEQWKIRIKNQNKILQ